MQTYIVHWQFPDQESHMQGAEAFAGFVEGGCEGDDFDGFQVVNRVLNPEGANGWAIIESSNHQNIWNGVASGSIILGWKLKSRRF